MSLFTVIRDSGEPRMIIEQSQDSMTARVIISLVKDGQKYIVAARDFDLFGEAYKKLKDIIENIKEDCE